MALDLNMDLVSRNIFPSLLGGIGPVLDFCTGVEDNPYGKTVNVKLFSAPTAREFDQSTASYTEDAVNNTGIDVTLTELYHIAKINHLVAEQTNVDLTTYLAEIGAALADKMFAKVNALVTAASYTGTALTSTAANFDADDLADLAGALSVSRASKMNRTAVLGPLYTAALSKDNVIQAAYSFGSDSVIRRNEIPTVHGFRIQEVYDVAASGDVAALEGWVAAPEAFAVGFGVAPIQNPMFPTAAKFGSFTAPIGDSGKTLTITTKMWDGNDGNYRLGGFIKFGAAAGQTAALRIIKSA